MKVSIHVKSPKQVVNKHLNRGRKNKKNDVDKRDVDTDKKNDENNLYENDIEQNSWCSYFTKLTRKVVNFVVNKTSYLIEYGLKKLTIG